MSNSSPPRPPTAAPRRPWNLWRGAACSAGRPTCRSRSRPPPASPRRRTRPERPSTSAAPFSLQGGAEPRYGWSFNGGAWRNTWTGTETRPAAEAAADAGPNASSYASLGHRAPLAWELALDDGTYDVSVVAGGTAGPNGEPIRVAAEGGVFLEQVPTAGSPFADATLRLEVTDGRLTLTAPDGLAVTRLVSVHVRSVDDTPPSAVGGGGTSNNTPTNTGVALGPFEARQSLKFPAMEGAIAKVGGKLYAWGGYDYYNGQAQKPLVSNGRGQVYDPAADAWSAVADLPTPLTHAQAATYGGKIYIFGGFDDGAQQVGPNPATYVYDPATDTMSRWGTMPYPVSGYGLAQVGSRVYLISGMYGDAYDFQGESRHVFSIDLADPDAGYRDEPDAPVGREHVGTAVVDGKIYLFGGETGHDQYAGVKADAFVYDPATRQWTRLADLPDGGLAHTEQTTVTVGGKILVAGGNVNGVVHENFISTIRLYDPATDQWSTLGDLPEPRRGAYVRVIGDYLYVAGGDGDYPRNTLWRAKLTIS